MLRFRACKFIKQKYPNAVIEDILTSAGKFFMEEVINKKLVFSDKKEIEETKRKIEEMRKKIESIV